MEELFGALIGYGFFGSVGFLYSHLRYHNRARVKQKLATKYDNSCANAGQVVALNSVAVVGALLISGLVFVFVVAALVQLVHRLS